MKKQKNGSGRNFSKNRKIPKEPHFEFENFKPNIKNLFYQILVYIPKILYVKNEEDPVENKKWLGAMFWQNLMNQKMVQATPKISRCAVFSYICAFKGSQNSLVSKSEKFLELALKLEKLWPK
jgi:hypothetical protein